MKRILARAYLWLTKVQPLWFASIYLIAIPSFAGAYAFLGEGFYAPYSHLEKEWVFAEYELGDFLEKAIKSRVMEFPKVFITDPKTGYQVMRDKYTISDVIVSVTGIDVTTDSRIKFETLIRAGFVGNNIDFDANPGISGGPGHAYVEVGCTFVTSSRADRVGPFKQLFLELPTYTWDCEQNAVENLLPVSNLWDLPMSLDEQKKLKRLVQGFNGSPASINGNYWRMLYLSVVIITTLGLGDIVPISSSARLLVGIESVFGVILVGLFLNAITWQASHPEPAIENKDGSGSDVGGS